MSPEIFNAPPLKMIDLNAYDVFSGMVVAFVLSLILAKVSAWASRHKALYSNSNLWHTMILLSAIVSLIMSVIGNSLARAFGAIGALSLIRFRTAIKDPIDLAQLFMTISIGMATGSGYPEIAAGATVLYAIFMVLLEYLPINLQKNKVFLVKMTYKNTKENADKTISLLKKNCLNVNVLSEQFLNKGDLCETIVEITDKKTFDFNSLFIKLTEIEPEIKTVIINN